MSARQNLIVVLPRCSETVRRALIKLQPDIADRLGSLQTISVQNFVTGSLEDQSIMASPTDALPSFSDEETVVFYASEPCRGTVMLSHEGSYDLVVLSFSEHGPTLDLVTQIWKAVGADAYAVLAGDELDVEEKQLGALLESEEIPQDLDLCQAAVVKSPLIASRTDHRRELLEHGGKLLLR